MALKIFKPSLLTFFSLCLMGMLLTLPSVFGQTLDSGWVIGSASPVSPQAAGDYYQQKNNVSIFKTMWSNIKTMWLNIITKGDSAAVSAATTEITELARALQYDPKRIYDYVHNYIDYVPYFGLLKGPALTLLDKSGNDFDQASLMIALLQVSGYTARYEYGTMSIPGYQLSNWVGVGLSTAINYNVFGCGGIPISILNSSEALVSRVWVKANIEGVDYRFDPALKSYVNKPKIDLEQSLGYSRNDFLAAITSGATVTDDYTQNLNEQALSVKLTEYSNNLVNAINNEYPNRTVEEIIGGRDIVETTLTEYQTALPLLTTITAEWDQVPVEYIATLKIEHVGIDYTFYIPEISGKRLTVTYAVDNNYRPELRLEGELIAAGNSTTPETRYDLTLTIDHPYAANNGTYADQISIYNMKSGGTYTFISAFSGIHEELITQRQKLLDTYRAQGLSQTSEEVLGESLNIMGLTWLNQTQLVTQLVADTNDFVAVEHHCVGRMCQESSYYIDVANWFYSWSPKSDINADTVSACQTSYAFCSALEHGVLEQMMGQEIPCVSTIKLLHLANTNHDRIFYVTNDNFVAIRPQLQNYNLTLLDMWQTEMDDGIRKYIILPQNGKITLNQWQGMGYISGIMKHGQWRMEWAISGGLNGGYGSFVKEIEAQMLENHGRWSIDFDEEAYIPKNQSLDPVDMASGAFVHNRTDLSLGSKAPLGLTFSRSYSSSLNEKEKTLGYGWMHNYDISLQPISHSRPGLGRRRPVEAAPFITALYVTHDLLTNQDGLTGWMARVLTSKWAIDQLINNAVSVHIGTQIMDYIKLADSIYSPPPGVTTQLIDNGDGTFSLLERFGTRLAFNADNLIAKITDVDGNAMTFTYDNNRLTKVNDTFGRGLDFTYIGNRLSSVTDSTGRSFSYSYDVFGNLISYTDAEGKIWQYTYDTNHRMTSLINSLGITTAVNTYDNLGRVVKQTVPRQGDTTVDYDFYFPGFRNVEKGPQGNETVYFYDAKGNPVGEENSLGSQTWRKYDGQNHITETIDPNGNKTSYAYDKNQNLIRSINALNKITAYTYDSQFRLTDITDSLNHTTHMDYDANHHLTVTTDAEANQNKLTYYANGLKKTTTDARGTATALTYDANGHLKTSCVGVHPQVIYVYDAIGRMKELTDQEGSTTRFEYDNLGRITKTIDPLGKNTVFVYDAAGQLSSVTDRNNDTTSYTYTHTGKVDTITFPGPTTVSFTYDILDNLKQIKDEIGITSYTYDAANRLTSVVNPHGFVVTYAYDAAGNVTSLTYPSGKTVVYSYDTLNRVKTVTSWLGQTAVYTYDPAGRLTNLINFNGTITTYGYDNANRLTSLKNEKNDNRVIASYSFKLDGNGNREQVEENEPLAPALNEETIAYAYTPKANRLQTVGADTYTWDDEGQLSNLNGETFSFDYLHRLAKITGTASLQYAYDGANRRLQAIRNGVITRYIYDATGNLLAEADSANVIIRYYIHGAGLLAMVTPDDKTYCYHYNAIGNTIAISDAAQTIVNKYTYTPFGKVANQEETISQPFKFVGQYGVMAEPNGFYYMRARYYDPKVGRFISEDPEGFEGGINFYAYTSNNPIIWIDPWGLARLIVHVDDRFSEGTLTGHGAVTLTNDNGTSETIGNHPGGWQDDSDIAFDISHTWDISQEQADATREAITQPGYNFFNDNCIDRVENALHKSGIEHPNFNTFGISDPSNAYDWLLEMNESQRGGQNGC